VKVSVFPPFGTTPTKASPSIRPPLTQVALPERPLDFKVAWVITETAFWAFMAFLVWAALTASPLSLALAAAAVVAYVVVLKVLRWMVHAGHTLMPLTPRTEPPPPLGGIRATTLDRLQYSLIKAPMQNFRFFKFVLFFVPRIGLKLALESARKGGYRSPITDEDCWQLLVSTACVVPAVLSDDGSTLELTTPPDLPLRTPDGRSFANVLIRFDVPSHRLLLCRFEGRDVTPDKELVAGILHSLLIGWFHGKSHVSSEAAARVIRSQGLKSVAGCAEFTFSLHEYLVYVAKGPLQTDNQSGVVGKSIYESVNVPMPHSLDRRKLQFRYFEVLFKSRMVVKHMVEKHGVGVPAELLFNTCVTHSLDHLNAWEWARHRLWSIDLTKSHRSRLISAWFTDFYVRPMTNPFFSEYLRDAPGDFYRELYTELSAVDKKLADALLLSTSY
jgi:hypothetical protein